MEITPKEKLGNVSLGWLDACHHFSFGDYYDPARMGYGPLRVWNDDTFHPGGGFPMHPHKDMEIITYVRRGAISHEDSLGNKGETRAGEVQVMSAGTGIRHSEYNHGDEALTLFQIWIEPDQPGHAPRWDATEVPAGSGDGFRLLVSGRERHRDSGALFIHSDSAFYSAHLAADGQVEFAPEPGRGRYIVPARGDITINGQAAPERAGIAVPGEEALTITASRGAEVVLLDLPLD